MDKLSIRRELVVTVPEALADNSCTLGEKIRRGLPNEDLIHRTWHSVRDAHGISEKAVANVVPESWRDRVLHAREEVNSRQYDVEVLPVHDDEITNSHKA